MCQAHIDSYLSHSCGHEPEDSHEHESEEPSSEPTLGTSSESCIEPLLEACSAESSTECVAQCCEDTLEVFQVTTESILKKTRKVQGHGRQFCADWFKKHP